MVPTGSIDVLIKPKDETIVSVDGLEFPIGSPQRVVLDSGAERRQLKIIYSGSNPLPAIPQIALERLQRLSGELKALRSEFTDALYLPPNSDFCCLSVPSGYSVNIHAQ